MKLKKFYKHKNWYKKTRSLLMKKYKKDYKLFSGLLASTSPRFQVKRNYNISLLIYNDYIANPSQFLKYAIGNKARFLKKYKLLNAHYNNIIRTLSHNFTSSKKLILSGNKVNSFYNNIIGKYHYVTIDIWMIRYFKIYDKSQLNLSEYKYYTRIIRKLALKLKMLPCELQAVLWERQRYIESKKPSNFYQYIQAV